MNDDFWVKWRTDWIRQSHMIRATCLVVCVTAGVVIAYCLTHWKP